MSKWPGHHGLTVAVLLALAVPVPSHAFDLDYNVGLNAWRSDNITLSEAAPVEDTVVEPTMRFEVSQTGADLQLSGQGLVRYTDYRDDSFQDEFRGGFSGGMDWAIVPSRFNFVVQDYLSQQTVDDQDRTTPNNLQQINLFVAGPSFYTRFNPATRGQFDLRYGNTYAEDTEGFNGDRYSAAARVRRELSTTTEISGNLESARVAYDPGGAGADYRRHDADLGVKLFRSVVDADLELGYSQLTLRTGDKRSSAPLVRANAAWNLTARSRLRLDVRYQFADATQYLITPKVDFGERRFTDVSYTDITVTPEVFRERNILASYAYSGGRTTLRVQPYIRRSDYVNPLVEDQKLRGAAFDVEYRARPLLTLSFFITREQREFEAQSRKDTDTRFEVGLAKRFTRNWTGGIQLRRGERDSSEAGQSYRDNVALLSINYRR